MNVFVLSLNPAEAARAHCDKHVVKMCLESAQILSTCHHIHGTNSLIKKLYKPTHQRHQCVINTSMTHANYEWVHHLFYYLLEEYKHRYGKTHACAALLRHLEKSPQQLMGDKLVRWATFAQAMPDKYKHPYNPVEAYRRYYIGEKSHMLQYTKREAPEWLVEMWDAA